MDCDAVKEMLWAYLEKETTAEETVKIEEHLKDCEDCRKELELQQELMETLAGLPDEELPDRFHDTLMQKLKAETTANVVPFPQKAEKKKQPGWKQLSLIAAAVLVVVAAGGMNGMLEMRESQNAAIAEMKATDTVESMEYSVDDMMDNVALDEEDSAAPKAKTTQDNKKMNAPAAGMDVAVATAEEGTIAAYDGIAAEAVPAEETMEFSMIRSAKAEANDKAELLVMETAAAMAELQKAIAEAGGYEEPATEGSVFAVIPVENYDDFVKTAEGLGTLTWKQKSKTDDGTAYQTIEIVLKTD